METLPLLCFTWGLKQDYIPHENIVQETSIVCASWMVLGEDKTPKSVSILDDQSRFKKSVYDDTHCVKELHQVISDADILLGQNADRFDLPTLQSRATLIGLPPLQQKDSIDTLKEAKKVFRLPSHKLDFMARFFLNEKKMDTGGMRLWLDILQRDYPTVGETPDPAKAEKAIKKMVRYNKRDVKLTADLYEAIKPYMKRHPNVRMYNDGEGCPRCGSKNIKKRGVRVRMNGKFQTYKCRDCLGWFSSSLSEGRDHIKVG